VDLTWVALPSNVKRPPNPLTTSRAFGKQLPPPQDAPRRYDDFLNDDDSFPDLDLSHDAPRKQDDFFNDDDDFPDLEPNDDSNTTTVVLDGQSSIPSAVQNTPTPIPLQLNIPAPVQDINPSPVQDTSFFTQIRETQWAEIAADEDASVPDTTTPVQDAPIPDPGTDTGQSQLPAMAEALPPPAQ
jgi:hypothetical protein